MHSIPKTSPSPPRSRGAIHPRSRRITSTTWTNSALTPIRREPDSSDEEEEDSADEDDEETAIGNLRRNGEEVSETEGEGEESDGEDSEDESEDEDNDEEKYDAERIHAEKGRGKTLHYEVEWTGYAEHTWEPAAYLSGTLALQEWKKRGKKAWEAAKKAKK